MDRFFLIVPVLAGILGVLQNALNRKIGDTTGLTSAIIFNNIILLAASLVVGWAVYRFPSSFPEAFHFKRDLFPKTAIAFLPALMGLTFLLLVPFSFMKVGAYVSYVVLITAQVITTLFWDSWVEDLPFSPQKAIGALLCLAGAVLSALPQNVEGP